VFRRHFPGRGILTCPLALSPGRGILTCPLALS
jgi:hypothetical protein